MLFSVDFKGYLIGKWYNTIELYLYVPDLIVIR